MSPFLGVNDVADAEDFMVELLDELVRLQEAVDASNDMLSMFGRVAFGEKPTQEQFNKVAERFNRATKTEGEP